jgi:hypothetical protein
MKEDCRIIRVDEAMEQMVEKLTSFEREAASEKGDFLLFGLFLREDAQDRWDLLASAPWLEERKIDGLRYLSDRLQPRLDAKERLLLSRIVILEKDNQVLAAIQRVVSTSHTPVEVQDSVFFGMQIRHAYIITATKE